MVREINLIKRICLSLSFLGIVFSGFGQSWQDNGTHMRLDPQSANLGIGLSGYPSYKLDVKDVGLSNGEQAVNILYGQSSSFDNSDGLNIQTGSSPLENGRNRAVRGFTEIVATNNNIDIAGKLGKGANYNSFWGFDKFCGSGVI